MINNHLRPLYKKNTRGAALLLLMVFFMIGSLLVILGVGRTSYYDTLRFRTLKDSKQVYYATESGLSDVVYRLRKGQTTSATETLMVGGVTATTTKTTVLDLVTITTDGVAKSLYRSARAVMRLGAGASFNFGLQSSTGGIEFNHPSASVTGNVYSNGPVVGVGANMIYGDVVSAGASGLIDKVHATGSAFAHTILASSIDGNAYHFTTGTMIGSTASSSFPGSPDQPPEPLPIPDSDIEDWKNAIALGGTVPLSSCSPATPAGTYTINSSQSIGPIKVPCNLLIKKTGPSMTLTFTGPIWVEGNVTTESGPNLQIDPSLPDRTIQIIADNATNLLTSSKISINSGTSFTGATGNSYFLVISMNNSAELSGTESAIDTDNNTVNREVIYYAPHGKLSFSNSAKLRGASGYLLSLSNSANVEYDTGMVSLLFTSGAGGSYVIDSWTEIE